MTPKAKHFKITQRERTHKECMQVVNELLRFAARVNFISSLGRLK